MRSWKIANGSWGKVLTAEGPICLLAIIGALASWSAYAREVIDSTGVRTVLGDHPTRVITLAPSLGELVADLEGDRLERIIGVSEYTDYPPALKKVASIGPYSRFNMEKVLSLKPDLVFATLDGNSKDQIVHLRELHVPVVVVGTGTLAEIEQSIRLVAEAVGEIEAGKQMVTRLQTGVERLKKRGSAHKTRATVLLQVGYDPLVVVGHKSFLHEALAVIGAQNLYADVEEHYPRPAVEDAVHRNPDVVVILSMGSDLSPVREMAKRWAEYPQMKAVHNHKIRVLQGDTILRPTLRLLEGLSLLERAVWGEPRAE